MSTFFAQPINNRPLTSLDNANAVYFGYTYNNSPTLGNYSNAMWSTGKLTVGNFADVSFQPVRFDANHWDYFLSVAPTGFSNISAVYATVMGRDGTGRAITTPPFQVPLGISLQFGALGPVNPSYPEYPHSSLDPGVYNRFLTGSLLPAAQLFYADTNNSALVQIINPTLYNGFRGDAVAFIQALGQLLAGAESLPWYYPTAALTLLVVDIADFTQTFNILTSTALAEEQAFETAFATANQLAQKTFYPTQIVLTAVSDNADPSIVNIGGPGQVYTNSFTILTPTQTTGMSAFYLYQNGPVNASGPILTTESLDASGNVFFANSTITLNQTPVTIQRQAFVILPFQQQPDGSLYSPLDKFVFNPGVPVQTGTNGCLSGSNALSNFSTTGNVSITVDPTGSPAILLTKSSPSSATTQAQIPGPSSLLVFQYAWPNAFNPTEVATFTIDFTSMGQTTLLFQSAASDPTAHSTTLLPQTVAIPPNLQGQQGALRFLLTPSSTDTVLSQVMVGDFAIVQGLDTTPPVITVKASPSMLWPPDSMMKSVTVTGTITDSESGGTGVNPTTAIFSVKDEYGQVQPGGNLTLNPDGSYTFTIQLLASRNGTDLDGRQYTITVSAQDNAGNKASAITVVTVPHDQGKHM